MLKPFVLSALLASVLPAAAHDLKSEKKAGISPSFDILSAEAKAKGRIVAFRMTMAGKAGAVTPKPAGKLAGAEVFAYVWPTTLDPAVAGFAKASGILALAVTSHPDFDDTPLFDEDGDGDPNNDGKNWHSHWVVLAKDEACGPGGLKVRDISPGEDIAMPATAPGLPLMLDSPGYSPLIRGADIAVNSAVGGPNQAAGAGFDAVTARLRVHKETKAPLLCVVEAMDVASGKLDLSGRIVEEK
ncbi:MAG: hypothetical protein IT539_06900 [Bradyrhizobiaceae bacterium]|nr:hypothetical protein [Bradyrhizobiaceae bacterium]